MTATTNTTDFIALWATWVEYQRSLDLPGCPECAQRCFKLHTSGQITCLDCGWSRKFTDADIKGLHRAAAVNRALRRVRRSVEQAQKQVGKVLLRYNTDVPFASPGVPDEVEQVLDQIRSLERAVGQLRRVRCDGS